MVKLDHTLESYLSFIPLNQLSRTCFSPLLPPTTKPFSFNFQFTVQSSFGDYVILHFGRGKRLRTQLVSYPHVQFDYLVLAALRSPERIAST